MKDTTFWLKPLDVQVSTGYRKCKTFEIHERADEPNFQEFLVMKGKAYQVEDGYEPYAQVRLDEVQAIERNAQVRQDEDDELNAQVRQDEDEAVEPNAQVLLDEDEAAEPNAQVLLDEDEAVEPNAQVLLDEDEADDRNGNDEIFNAIEVENANAKRNLVSCRCVTFGVGCRMHFLSLIIALSFSVGNSAFVEVPNNTVLQWKSPAAIHMACKSDCQCNLRWFVNKNQGSEKEDLYNGYALSPDASSYCWVSTDEPGNYYLNLMNEPDAAQTYICFEPGTLAEASADLILLSNLINSDSSTEDLVNLTCSIEFRGNWAPVMEWKEYSIYGEKVLTVGVNTVTVPNQRVTSTLVIPAQEGSRNYTCATKFDISGKPLNTTARNTPDGSQALMFMKSQDEMTIKSPLKVGAIVAISFVTVLIAATSGIVIVYRKRMREVRKKAMEAKRVESVSLNA